MTSSPEHCRPGDARPDCADAAPVGCLEADTVRLFDLEQQQAARTLMPAVARRAADIVDALRGFHGEHERHRLTLMHGQAMALAGWLVFEQGDVRGIHRYWDMALGVAQEIKNEPLLACVQTYLSYAVADRGDPATALQLAHTALSHAGDDSRVRAWIAARIAQEAAGLGDQAAAFANLDLAMELCHDLKSVAPSDTTPPWARFVDRAYVCGMVANAFSRMRITSDAYLAAIWARDALSDGQTKARALTLAEIACAFTAVRQLDEALPYVAEAAELAEKLEATRVNQRLRAVVQLLPSPRNAGPGS